MIVINLVTPKAAAKQELLFNQPEAVLLNKSSRLAAILGVTQFLTMIGKNLVTLCCTA
jgi:hypothetical protein